MFFPLFVLFQVINLAREDICYIGQSIVSRNKDMFYLRVCYPMIASHQTYSIISPREARSVLLASTCVCLSPHVSWSVQDGNHLESLGYLSHFGLLEKMKKKIGRIL